MTQTLTRPHEPGAFRHEALLYGGDSDFVARTTPLIRGARAADDPVLVVVSAAKIDLLRSALDGDGDSVMFADMSEVGRNPARIIPAWRQFMAEHGARGRRPMGIGEPIWAGRSPAELIECQRHESLLNLVFDGSPGWWLLCPYDTKTLDAGVIDEARRRHPFILQGGRHQKSADYRDNGIATAPFVDPLPEPPGQTVELAFVDGPLDAVRGFAAKHAADAGLGTARTADFLLAVNEVASNSLRHGGGEGVLRIWRDGDALICEIRDKGHIDQPLIGRQFPPPDKASGRGLWLVNGLCDLLQLHSSPAGSVVRLHMRRS